MKHYIVIEDAAPSMRLMSAALMASGLPMCLHLHNSFDTVLRELDDLPSGTIFIADIYVNGILKADEFERIILNSGKKHKLVFVTALADNEFEIRSKILRKPWSIKHLMKLINE
jgi:hypothetical protein